MSTKPDPSQIDHVFINKQINILSTPNWHHLVRFPVGETSAQLEGKTNLFPSKGNNLCH